MQFSSVTTTSIILDTKDLRRIQMILTRSAALPFKKPKPATRIQPKLLLPRVPLFWSTPTWPSSSLERYKTFVASLLRPVFRPELWTPDRMSWWFLPPQHARVNWRLDPVGL